ncbi:MAG: peptide deformylase [Acidimicrobiales bacterium]
MPPYSIRILGDPVLTEKAAEIAEIDGSLARLADDMIVTMHDAPGLGLAAPQVGVQKRMFVYDLQDDEGPKVLINPTIAETRGEWEYEEGCLSVPGLAWDIVRPKEVHLTGFDIDGNELSIEADELEARLFQHELDHLDGVLLLERLDKATRKQAMKTIREITLDGGGLRRSDRGEHLL